MNRDRIAVGVLLLGVGLSAAAAGAATGTAAKEAAQASLWTHAGPTSAVVYWRMPKVTDEARSYVEYGPTPRYGKQTATTKQARWAHLHRLENLRPGRKVYFRAVTLRDGKRTFGPAGTLVTPAAEGFTALSAPPGGGTLTIDRPGRYRLAGDLTAKGTAIVIAAGGVELDLDGHTVGFATAPGKQSAGIQMTAKGPVAVRNGVVIQGDKAADYSACVESRWRAWPREISGITAIVDRPNGYPIKFLGAASGARVHHNLLISGVTEIESRHYPGNDLIRLDVGKPPAKPCRVEANILTRGCHRGISVSGTAAGTKVLHNDIRHRALYVNGYAISLHAPGIEAAGNRITSVGRGMHLTAADLHVRDNYLDLTGHATLDDMPAKSRPFKKIMVELHGIKLEGAKVTGAKVHGNYVRIRQLLPGADNPFVPATPLNVACYHPAAMNEIYDNDIVALTWYRAARIGGYGNSGQWASALHLVGMTRGPAPAGRYSAYIHDNRFVSNHLYVSASSKVTQTVRIERNRFRLAKDPPPVPAKSRLRNLGPAETAVRIGKNVFE